MEERTCQCCHEKDTTVELRQNDLLMCDLCWGRPVSEDCINYRNKLRMKDVDKEVLEESPAVLNVVKAFDNIVELADDEAVPAILDVATLSAVKVKEQMKDKQNLSNNTDDENELNLLDNEGKNTLTEDESFQQTQKDQQQECEPASSTKSNMADHDSMMESEKDKGLKGASDDKRFIYSELVKSIQIRTTKANRTQYAWLGSPAKLKDIFKSALDIEGIWRLECQTTRTSQIKTIKRLKR